MTGDTKPSEHPKRDPEESPVASDIQDDETEAQNASRLGRVVEQVRSISEDLVELVEMKVQLLQLRLEEQVENRINHLIGKAMVVVLAGMTVMFMLVSAAIALGYVFENHALGFLAIAAVTGVATLVLWRLKFYHVEPPDMEGSERDEHIIEAEKELPKRISPHETE
jgi:uncharacterized membrane protein YqjE